MLMAQAGTQVPEKEFTFTTPVAHGLSYKICNPDHKDFKTKVAQCWDYVEASAKRGGPSGRITAEDLVKRVLNRQSDLWVCVSEQTGEIKGSFTISEANYPRDKGIFSESCGGEFVFTDMFPMVEEFYKGRGYTFVEVVGRKGWERELGPLGYKLEYISIHKRI